MDNKENKIRLSVITFCLDNSKGITRTADSIVSERYAGMEWIIVRGNKVRLDGLKGRGAEWKEFVAEEREPIGTLMNKAVKVASGTWVLFMPKGSSFPSVRTLALFDKRLVDCYDIVAGDTLRKGPLGVHLEEAMPLGRMRGKLPFRLESTFLKRETLLDNPFDADYRAALDFELLLRLRSREVVDLVTKEPVTLSQSGMLPSGFLGIARVTERRRALGKEGGIRHLLGWGFEATGLLCKALMGLVFPRALRDIRKVAKVRRQLYEMDRSLDLKEV